MQCKFELDHEQEGRITRNANDIQCFAKKRESDNLENTRAHSRLHKRIDVMKNMFMVGMASLVIECLMVIIYIAVKLRGAG